MATLLLFIYFISHPVQRNNEFGHLHDISLQTDIKMAEIMCARKIQNRTLLCNFLSTKVCLVDNLLKAAASLSALLTWCNALT